MIIAPSLLAADAGRYSEEILSVQNAGAEYLHIDVMDGHFVPNLSFGPNILMGIRKDSNLFLDVHLMIEHPADYFQAFIDAGADGITIHAEVSDDWMSIQKACKSQGVSFGISLCPKTSLRSIMNVLPAVDILLIMGINPGFGGQKLLPDTYEKIEESVKIRSELDAHFLISMDGGVDQQNAVQLASSGVDILVAGSAVFGNIDRKAAMIGLKSGGAK
ncbi:MAG: ribulose-phosphate 3-epimerase [Eubacteriales bacterium]